MADPKTITHDDANRLERIANALEASRDRFPTGAVEDARWLRSKARAALDAPPQPVERGELEGHRVEIVFGADGLGPMARLLHPATGCDPGEGGRPGTCWLDGWLENADEPDGLLRGTITVPVASTELDGDQPLFHLAPAQPLLDLDAERAKDVQETTRVALHAEEAQAKAEADLDALKERLTSDGVVEAVAVMLANDDAPYLEQYEAHLAKHGRADEGYRAQSRRFLEAARAAAFPDTEGTGGD